MGLDAYLYQFKDIDTDAIVELSKFYDEMLEEAYMKWKALGESERPASGPISSPAEARDCQAKLVTKARQLGLSDDVPKRESFGGITVRFPSKKYPGWFVGDWDPHLGGVNGLLIHLTGKDLYYVFPEANGDPHFFKPDWQAAKERLLGLVANMQKDSLGNDEDSRHFKWMFDGHIEFIGVMLETMDYVISQANPEQFLIYWST